MDLNNVMDMQVASLEYAGVRVVVRENEEALIGSVLRGGFPVFERVREIVKPEMFGNVSLGHVWNAIERIAENGMTIDTITVGDELERALKLNEVSNGHRTGRGLLTDLRQTGDPRGAESYAENVQDYFFKKKLEEYGKRMVVWSANGRRSADIIKDIDKLLSEIVLYSGKAVDHVWDIKDAVGLAYDETDEAAQGIVKTVQTGLFDLDVMLNGGMRKGQLIIGGARPGQGKTGLLVTVTLNAARKGKRSLVFSLEMTATELAHRYLSQISEIPVDRLMSGKLTEREWPVYVAAVDELASLPITIIDLPAMRIGNVRQMARREMSKNKIDLIGFDYIQLGEPDKNSERRQIDVGQVSRGLKALAKELDVPVFSLAQLSRGLEQRQDKRPMLSDLREAGDLEQDADVVIFIYRPDQYESNSDKQNTAELIIAKQRNGQVGSVDTIFRPVFTRFENATKAVFRPNE